MAKKRDSIAYYSPYGGEWLKTRDVHKALAKVLRLLEGLTTFETWATATLSIQVTSSPELQALTNELERGEPATRWERRDRTFDRVALTERGIVVDDVMAAALARFGPARCRRWGGNQRHDWKAGHYELNWTAEQCAMPEGWVQHVVDHQAMKSEIRHRVELSMGSGFHQWRVPGARTLLPFQDPAHYPPFANTKSGCRLHVGLSLPTNTMILGGRFPFLDAGAEFLRYYDHLTKALGHALSPKNFRAQLSNQQGTATYDRKIAFARP